MVNLLILDLSHGINAKNILIKVHIPSHWLDRMVDSQIWIETYSFCGTLIFVIKQIQNENLLSKV